MSKIIVVTGGAGFIGSHVCAALATQGYTPVCVDDLSQGHEWAVKWGPLEKVNVLDLPKLSSVFAKYKPIAVMHFAAISNIRTSGDEPISYYETNVAGSLNVLHCMRELEISQIVFSSTASVYGEPGTTVISEEHPLEPINVYGRSKLMIETVLRDFAPAFGLNYVSLRYFNAAGADIEAGLGEVHTPETHLIPLALRAAIDPSYYLELFGTDFPTPDGSAIRDYVHVRDIAEAHVNALEIMNERTLNCSLNIGSGIGYSNLEILKTIEKIVGKPVKYRLAARCTSDPATLIASHARAKDILHIEFQHSSIEEIISSAYTFYSSQALSSRL